MSVGYHFRLSSERTCERPRRYSPPGINTISGGAAQIALAAKIGRTRRSACATVLRVPEGWKKLICLTVNRPDVIRRYITVGSERIDVGISPSGWRVANLLAPVDAE